MGKLKETPASAKRAEAEAERRKTFAYYRTFHLRTHGSEVRIWDADQGQYGQFGVLTMTEAITLKKLLEKQGATFVWIEHHDGCDGYDDTCKCRRLEHGKGIE